MFLLGIYDILQVFSTDLLRQLPWRRSIETVIIWFTRQIKILKIVETFSWKTSMVEYCFHKFAESHYRSRSWKNYFSRTAEHKAQPAEHTDLSSSDLETFS